MTDSKDQSFLYIASALKQVAYMREQQHFFELLTSGLQACAVESCSATRTAFGNDAWTPTLFTKTQGVLRNVDEVPFSCDREREWRK